jgi:hypothetical protein
MNEEAMSTASTLRYEYLRDFDNGHRRFREGKCGFTLLFEWDAAHFLAQP